MRYVKFIIISIVIQSCIGNSKVFNIPDLNNMYIDSLIDKDDKTTTNVTLCIHPVNFKGAFQYTLEAIRDPGALRVGNFDNLYSDTCIHYDWYSGICKFKYVPLDSSRGSLKFKLSIF